MFIILLNVLGFIVGYINFILLVLVLFGLMLVVWLVLVLLLIVVIICWLYDIDCLGWWLLFGFVLIVGLVVLVFMLLFSMLGDNWFGKFVLYV